MYMSLTKKHANKFARTCIVTVIFPNAYSKYSKTDLLVNNIFDHSKGNIQFKHS